jgi:hypothetical protein
MMIINTILLRARPRRHLARAVSAGQRRLTATAIGALLAGILPAQAQWYERPPGFNMPPEPYGYSAPRPVFRGDARPLPPNLIVERLEDRGFEEVGRPRYNGSTYEVDATSPRGRRIRIVFDAFEGNEVGRYAIGRMPEEGSPGYAGEPRGWFGNNLRPPEEARPRRFSNRPTDEEDDGPETFDRLSRPADPRLAPAPRVEVGPPVAGLPAPAPGRGTEPAAPAPAQAPARTASRPRDVPAPSSERAPARSDVTSPDLGKVEGVNPGAAGAAAKPAVRAPGNERASRPDNNRQFEASKTDPARKTRPAEAPASPPAPAPVVTAPAAPSPDNAVTAEAARPDKPVRVIGGVTPMNPNGAEPKP